MTALAQDGGAVPSSALTPSLGAGGNYLETRGRNGGANGREFVATLSPGLVYVSSSGRVQGSLDLRSDISARRGIAETAGNDVRNNLNAAFLAEAVPNRAYVDVRAGISQQAISAFGEQSVEGSTRRDRNRTEVRTLALSPYARGPVGPAVEYELRVNGTTTRSSAEAGVDSTRSGGSLSLRSPAGGALLGWSLQATADRVEYENQQPLDNRRGIAGVTLTPSGELRLSLRAGRESIEEGTAGNRAQNNTVGAGLQWTPSARTNVTLDVEDRYFGRAGRASFVHRMPRSIWTYSYSRASTETADARGTGPTQAVTLYDLLFAQAASAYPDPAVRATVVRDLIASTGQDPNQIVSPGFQTSAISLQQRQDLSFLWLGQRTTLSVQGYTNTLSQIVLTSITDPVIGEPVRQHGYVGTLSYRLTPQASVLLGGSRQMTFATGVLPGNDLKSAFATLTQELGRKASASLVARYTVFNSPTDPYRETSVTASLNLRF